MAKQHGLKKNKFFIRLILWVIVAAMIPVMLLSYQSIVNSYEMSRSKYADEARLIAMHAVDSFDLVLDHLNMQKQVLALSKECKNFVAIKNGRELEEGKAPFTDLVQNYNYVFAKRDLRELISSDVQNNPLLSTIYYVDIDKNLVLDGTMPGYPIESFYDLSWMEKIDWNSARASTFIPVRSAPLLTGETKKVLTIVYRPFLESQKVALVYNIDAEYLTNKYIGNGTIPYADSMTVNDSFGKVLLSYSNGETGTDEPVSAIGQDRQKCTVSYPMTNGCSITLVRDINILHKEDMSKVNNIIMVAVSTAVFMLAGLLLLMLQLYKPVNRWSRQLQGDEVSMQGNWMTKGTEVESFGKWLQVSGTALRTRFWNQAVMGHIDNMDAFGHVHFHIELNDFLLAVVSLDGTESSRATGEEILTCSAVAQMFRDHLKTLSCDVVEMNDDTLLILINCKKEEQGKTSGTLMDVYRTIVGNLLNASDIAVGGWCAGLQDVKECYNRALLLQHYQRITGNLQTQYNLSVETSLGSVIPRIWEIEKNLSYAIQHNDFEEAKSILQVIKREIQSHINSMDYFQIKHRILCVTIRILDNYQQENGPANTVLDIPDDFYSRLIQSDSLDAIWEMLNNIIEQMSKNAEQTDSQGMSGPVQVILQMVEKDCGREMNLAQLSEKIGLSSVYISKLFKQSTGENYTQYLTRKRMETAKEMLRTGMQIQEIADKLGYSQSHYFSKIFREHYGILPSEFQAKNMERTE